MRIDPSIDFSALGVDSRRSILGVDSIAAAVAEPVDIDAMMGRDDDDLATAGAAALAAASAAAALRKPMRREAQAVLVPAGGMKSLACICMYCYMFVSIGNRNIDRNTYQCI